MVSVSLVGQLAFFLLSSGIVLSGQQPVMLTVNWPIYCFRAPHEVRSLLFCACRSLKSRLVCQLKLPQQQQEHQQASTSTN